MPGPLGIKDDLDLTDEQRCTLQYIEDFDLRSAVKASAEAGEIHAKEARSAERELKRFLALLYLEDAEATGVAPSKKVDSVWHGLILDTRTYMRFCYRVFGRFLHHVPESAEKGDVELAEIRAAGPTVQDYFEDVNEEFWPDDWFICWPYLRP